VVSVGAHLVVLGLPLSAPDSDLDQPMAAVADTEDVQTIAVAVLPQPQPETIPATPALPPADPQRIPPPPQIAPAAPLATAPVAAPDPVTTEPPLADFEPPKAEPVPPEPAAIPPEVAPYADFPHLSGAEPACPDVGHCWRSPASSWRSAAISLRQSLEAQGYTLDNITGEVLSTETGVRVYAVNRSGETAYYLNLVPVDEGVLYYSMTPTPITTADVMALQAF
jgi:hypothetical protein